MHPENSFGTFYESFDRIKIKNIKKERIDKDEYYSRTIKSIKKVAQTLGIKTILLNKDTELYNEIIKYINDTK